MRAMILAAGLGTRMAPVNRDVAKPALPVLDEPLVRRLITQLADQGVESVVVNAHAHAETLRDALRGVPVPVTISPEPELLGSGGGILTARRWLESDEPFWVLNADMRLDLDLAAFAATHREACALATLGLRDDPRKRKFSSIGYDVEKTICRIRELDRGGEVGSGLFIGVQLLEPRVFDRMPQSPAFDVIDALYIPAIQAGEKLAVWSQPEGREWCPIGDPRELLDANLEALGRAAAAATAAAAKAASVLANASARVEGEVRGPAWIGARATIEAGARVGPWAVVGAGATVRRGSSVEHSLLLPNANPPASALYRAIGYSDEVWSDA